MTWQDTREGFNEHNDCAVRALTVVSGEPYESVHDIFLQNGRKNRKKTPKYVTRLVLGRLSLRTIDVTLQITERTIRTFNRNIDKGRYLVWTRGHLVGFRGGECSDSYTRSLKRIIKVEKVVPECNF